MRKITVFSVLVLVFGLGLALVPGMAKASTLDSRGCDGVNPFSATTGNKCIYTSTARQACAPGDNFDFNTGAKCPSTTGEAVATSSVQASTASDNPFVSLNATPNPIKAGATSYLAWTSSGASSCTGLNFNTNGAWYNTYGVAVSPSTSTTYHISCTGPGGTTRKYVTLIVNSPVTQPLLSTPANVSIIDHGTTQAVLNWSFVSGATGYHIYRDGKKIADVSAMPYNDTSLSCNTQHTYFVVAFNSTKSSNASQSATVTTDACAPQPPTLDFSASPLSISSGASSILKWSSLGTSSCLSSLGWSGTKGTSGSVTVAPSATTSYGIACTGDDGSSVQKMVTVTVSQPTTALQLGDVNGNGQVNCTDLYMINSAFLGTITLTSDQKFRADLNGDSLVNSTDAMLLTRQYNLSCGTTSYAPSSSSMTANALGALNSATGAGTQVSSAANSCPLSSKTLWLGMKGREVKCLQQTLNTKGFTVAGAGEGKETEYFGMNTFTALKNFQAANGLKADGVFGPSTQAALSSN